MLLTPTCGNEDFIAKLHVQQITRSPGDLTVARNLLIKLAILAKTFATNCNCKIYNRALATGTQSKHGMLSHVQVLGEAAACPVSHLGTAAATLSAAVQPPRVQKKHLVHVQSQALPQGLAVRLHNG